MIADGWNQRALDHGSFPESHWYHIQPDQIPNISELFKYYQLKCSEPCMNRVTQRKNKIFNRSESNVILTNNWRHYSNKREKDLLNIVQSTLYKNKYLTAILIIKITYLGAEM
jgi:hypothetical protein